MARENVRVMAGREGIEPNADMRQMAAMWWQLYVALTSEGFSDAQALVILSEVIRNAWGSGGGQ